MNRGRSNAEVEERRLEKRLEDSVQHQMQQLEQVLRQLTAAVEPLDKHLGGRVDHLRKQLERTRNEKENDRAATRADQSTTETTGSLAETEKELWLMMRKKMKVALDKTTAYSKKHMREKNRLRIDDEKLKEMIGLYQRASTAKQDRERRELHESNEASTNCRPAAAAAAFGRLSNGSERDAVLDQLTTMIDARRLAGVMYERNLLTLRELEWIQSARDSPTTAAEDLLGLIVEQPDEVYECFLDSLKFAQHERVYEWLINKRYVDHNPNVRHTDVIQHHYVFLVDNMDTRFSGLLGHLFTDEVVTQTERAEIEAQPTSTHQNEKLLSVLSHKSADQFEGFLNALDKSGQAHVRNEITGRQRQKLHRQQAEIDGNRTTEDIFNELADRIKQGEERERNLKLRIEETRQVETNKTARESDATAELRQRLGTERETRLRDELTRSAEAYGELQRQLEEDARRLEDAKFSELELIDRLRHGQRREEELKLKLDETSAEATDLHQQIRRAKETESELREELATMTETHRELQRQVDDANDRLRQENARTSELQRQVEQAAERESKLIDELTQIVTAYDELQRQIDEHAKECGFRPGNARITEVDELMDKIAEGHEREQEMNARLEEMNAGMSELIRLAEARESEMQEQLRRCAEKESKLADELARLTAAHDELQRELDEVAGDRQLLNQGVERERQPMTEPKQTAAVQLHLKKQKHLVERCISENGVEAPVKGGYVRVGTEFRQTFRLMRSGDSNDARSGGTAMDDDMARVDSADGAAAEEDETKRESHLAVLSLIDFSDDTTETDEQQQHPVAGPSPEAVVDQRPAKHLRDLQPALSRKLTVPSTVCGIAHVDHKTFVVCSTSNVVQVFDVDGAKVQQIDVDGLDDPRDIVACPEAGALLIADWSADLDSGRVWRMSTGGLVGRDGTPTPRVMRFLAACPEPPAGQAPKSPYVRPRPVMSNYKFDSYFLYCLVSGTRPLSLAVTSRRLLITTQDDELLLVDVGDPSELTRVALPPGASVRHAAATSRDTFVICHLKPRPRVSEVDAGGRVLRAFDDPARLGEPCRLTVDEDGTMFVVDFRKHEVLQLDGDTMQLERVLLDYERNRLARFPSRLCWVPADGLLIVGSSMSDGVQVFALTE